MVGVCHGRAELTTGPPALLQPCVKGLAFPESPRWHDGALWFSDFYQRRVSRLGGDGRVTDVVDVPGQPSGLGWLPDGRLLVVSMNDRRLLRLDGDSLVAVADLSAFAPAPCNDMLVDAHGRAYVGNFGFDLHRARPSHRLFWSWSRPTGGPGWWPRTCTFPTAPSSRRTAGR